MAFWGSWGEEVEDIILCCPQTGNKDRRDFCNNVGAYDPTNPDSDPGDVNSICAGDDGFDELLCGRDKNDEYDICYQVKTVSVSQGIFVQDSDDDSITAVAKANVTEGTDFIFWNYSGKPPQAGKEPDEESDSAEPPRWRASSTLALSQYNSVAYKLKDGDTVGIYHWKDEGVDSGRVIVETGQNCTDLDALGVAEDGETPLLVESVAMERDSFRGTNLVVSVACALVSDEGDEEVEGDWGGIYLQTVCPPQIFRDDVIC